MKEFHAAVVFFICIFVFIAPAKSQQTSPNKLKVGMLLTLSGNFASAGEDCRKGVEAALSETGPNHALELVYADSKNEPATAISEVQKLFQVDKVSAIYTHRSSMGMALNPISQRIGMPLLGAVGHKDFASNNTFAIQVWPRSDDEGQFLAEEFLRRGYRRVAMIYTEDEWTSSVSQGFREKFMQENGTLIFDQPALPSVTDFRTQLAQIKSKSPDALYMNMLLPQIAPIIKQARELNVGGSYFLNFYVAKKDVVEAAGTKALENVRFVEIDTDLPKLKSILNPSEDISPPGLTVASYVATHLLSQVAQEQKFETTRDLMKSLTQQDEIRTPDYNYPIENRYVKFPLVVKVMRNGKGFKEAS